MKLVLNNCSLTADHMFWLLGAFELICLFQRVCWCCSVLQVKGTRSLILHAPTANNTWNNKCKLDLPLPESQAKCIRDQLKTTGTPLSQNKHCSKVKHMLWNMALPPSTPESAKPWACLFIWCIHPCGNEVWKRGGTPTGQPVGWLSAPCCMVQLCEVTSQVTFQDLDRSLPQQDHYPCQHLTCSALYRFSLPVTHTHKPTILHPPLCVSVFLSFIPQRWFILFLPSPPPVLSRPRGQSGAPSLCLDS